MNGLRATLAAIVALPVLAAAPAAAASCAYPNDAVRLSEHELVFAGEVTGTASDGRVAEVRVLDVWRGRDLPPEVTVFGGPEDDSFTSVDRVFVSGTTYAFFSYVDDEGVLRDNACTATARLAERASLDPPGVRAPQADAPAPVDPRTPPWMWLAGGGAVLTAGALALVLARRRAAR